MSPSSRLTASLAVIAATTLPGRMNLANADTSTEPTIVLIHLHTYRNQGQYCHTRRHADADLVRHRAVSAIARRSGDAHCESRPSGGVSATPTRSRKRSCQAADIAVDGGHTGAPAGAPIYQA